MTVPIGYPEKFGALLNQQRLERAQPQAPAAPGGGPPALTGTTAPAVSGTGETQKLLGPSFAEQLAQFVNDTDKTQKSAQTQAEEFAVGHNNDIHGTMIAVEQAEISLHLLANVRNRVVDLYREVMRMGS